MKIILISIFLASCSHLSKENKKKEFDYSTASVIQLARTAYIKGCIDGLNLEEKKYTEGIRFSRCKKKSEEYEKELNILLK